MSTNYKQITSFPFFFFYGNHIIPFVSKKKKKEREKLFNMYIKTTLLYIYVVYNFFKDGERLLCLTLLKKKGLLYLAGFFFIII